jgi:periplasmic protein TonB
MRFFRDISTLGLALTISVIVHAGLLTVRFVDPERFNRVFQDTPLEVILVNAKSNEKPDVAKAIAQASLAGGGELEAGRATTPLPLSSMTTLGDANEDMQRKLESMQEQQMLMLATIKSQLAAMPPPDPKLSSQNAEAMAQEQRRKQLLQLLAEIEKRINLENSRPKKRFISPATREEVFALYYDNLRRKIEDRGTQNFPEAAGNKLYGELTMSVTVNHDGRVLDTKIEETSGITALDRRAQSIAKTAGPFGKFSDEMRYGRRAADQIVVVSRFKFTRDETLETKLTSR